MNKKTMPAGVRVLLGFISFLLCVILFVCSIVTILVADLSLVTSKGSLQTLIKDIISPASTSYRIPMGAPAAILPGRSTLRLEAAGAQNALVDTLYGLLEEQLQGKIPLSKEQVEALVSESSLPDFLSDKVSGIVSDVITGEATTTITTDEIVDLLEENKELIEDTLHIEVTQDVVNSVTNWVDQNNIVETVQQEVANIAGVELPPPTAAPEASAPTGSGSPVAPVVKPNTNVSAGLELMDSMSKGEVEDFGITQALVMLRFITAPTVLYSCIAACLLLSLLLFLTTWGRPNAALRCSGISYLLSGILCFLPSVTAFLLPSLFASLGIAGNAIRKVLTLTASISGGVALFGLALIVAGAVWGSFLKKKQAAVSAE